MKLQNPHDKFFKETFGDVGVAKDFLDNYLPESVMGIIDTGIMELQKDSFINEEFQESFSDLLFKVGMNGKEGYLYFLFEHKSYPDKDVTLQLLKYMIEIWDAKRRKERTHELPIIIPLVIYHGGGNWKIKTSLGESISGYDKLPKDVQEFVPNYKYLLYDLSRYTDEEIKGQIINQIVMTIMRDMFTKNSRELLGSFVKSAEYLGELEDKQRGIEYFEVFVRYIFTAGNNISREDIEELIEKIERTYPEGSEKFMTLAEMFRKEGLEEGIEKGETKALEKTAIKLLTRRFGTLPEEIKVGISKLDAIGLEIIIDNIFEYDSLEDVNEYM